MELPMSIEEKIVQLITREQHLEPGKVTLNSTFEELGIDSLDGVYIMFALEEEFKISIPDSVARQMKSVRQVVNDLTRYMDNPEAFRAELATAMPVAKESDKPSGGTE
jgi:acyl carrier protein